LQGSQVVADEHRLLDGVWNEELGVKLVDADDVAVRWRHRHVASGHQPVAGVVHGHPVLGADN